MWKVLGYVTISNVLLTCWLTVLCSCGCGGVGVGWRRLLDQQRGLLFSWCESGCKFGFRVWGFCIFVFIFVFISL